jgi:hypothetical protein
MVGPSRGTAGLSVLILLCTPVLVNVGCVACNNRTIEELNSPNGRQKAVVFVRDCGATAWFTTEASILSRDDTISPRSKGNIMRVEDDQTAKEPISREGAIEVRLEWKGDALLNVSVPKKAVVDWQIARLGRIRIDYRRF